MDTLREIAGFPPVYCRNQDQLRRQFSRLRPLTANSLSELILSQHLVTPEQIRDAERAVREQPHVHIGHVLHDKGLISDNDRAWIFAAGFGLPLVESIGFNVDPLSLQLLPVEFARRSLVLPLMMSANSLVVAVSDPTDVELVERLQFRCGRPVELAIATPNDILLGITTHYSPEEVANAQAHIESIPPADTLPASPEDAIAGPVVQLVRNLIFDAIARRSSDIHLRPFADAAHVYFRIDGQLIRQLTVKRELMAVMIARLKILGGMDISERRLPQDGRAKVSHAGRNIDLRLSVMPGINGEDAVVRLLDAQGAIKDLINLGYREADAQRISALLNRTSGLMLVTGPTGSGKSSTLYSLLEQIRAESTNIVTIEDPVEYHIKGFTQIQINSQIGFTFAKALRHILRHDPNVIMVGEIRDEETARIAVECALTGHLVLSTLHTNGAAATVTRFLEIGIPSYLIGSTLTGVVAQRLVRCNCPHCLEPEEVGPGIRQAMNAGPEEIFYTGAGCDQCDQRGVRGRRAVYELLVMDNELRAHLETAKTSQELERHALSRGMTPLVEHALQLARNGVISLREAYRVRLD